MTSDVLTPDLCIVGGGSGGLSVAAGAVQMGASVVLIEGHKMGGDCLNYGCVPSKALLAAGKAAHHHRHSEIFGVASNEPAVDYAAAMGHVRGVIAGIEPHDSVERFEGLGVTVIQDYAKFTSPTEMIAGATTIRPRRFVLATGSSPAVPPIPGLADVPYLTNETLWDNTTLPDHLIIVGGGPIGMEMAQAHRRLGARVTVIEAARAFGREDPEVAAVAVDALRAEGIDIREGAKVASVAPGPAVTLADGETITGSHLLIATGRLPNLDRLDLEAGNVAATRTGVTVDKGLRSTTNRKVYAIGDVAGGLQFTHVANYHAGLVIRNALFRMPVASRTDHIPRVTYTDPEIAQVGPTEEELRKTLKDVEVYRFPYAENDRARAEHATTGMVKMLSCSKGKIHGVSIVGRSAGELIQPWSLALSKRLKVSDMAGHVAAYPTLGEVSKRAAGAYYAPRLFQSDRVKWIVRLLARLG